MKNIITCTGYGGTGSSVVSDLFKEFDDVKSFGDFEFRFLFEPSGVRELEFGIVENNDRLVTSYYIKKFIKNLDNMTSYEPFFDYKFKKYALEYIEELITLEWDGCWSQDILDANVFKKIAYRIEMIVLRKILNIKEGGVILYPKIFKEKIFYSNVDEEKFISTTKSFLNKIVENCDHENKMNIVFDQLMPPANLNSYLRYFDSIKVVVIDRDPRDLYLLNKVEWKEKWIPSDNIHEFISWFKNIRIYKEYNKDSEQVLRLKFEDFIYNYDKTIKQVCDFCGVDSSNHIDKKRYFDPEKSINNTHLTRKYVDFSDDIKLIEKELSQYCYAF
ncbi:sulfotransferase [Photobacterium iliopiscarium]|jgi:hypothetical protein|uniref:Sulfotransferase family protein n=1 Tax=Photobacterium iliopiscarium TaxID=56192 RepID=A0A2T3MNS9_9GAMM|nr:sulfotransferase [Photobacterium iliopiscarium]PSV98580.1 hypothetical protein C9I88_03885 [Photobacterium iliopiscarium]